MLPIAIRPTVSTASREVQAWVDTGFTGELMLPISLIHAFGLIRTGSEVAGLGDGKKVILERFKCWIDWFGQTRKIFVLANQGQFSLLGVGLMASHQLAVDYEKNLVELK